MLGTNELQVRQLEQLMDELKEKHCFICGFPGHTDRQCWLIGALGRAVQHKPDSKLAFAMFKQAISCETDKQKKVRDADLRRELAIS